MDTNNPTSNTNQNEGATQPPVEPANHDTEMSDADMQAALENMSNDELLDLFAEQMMVDKGLRDEVDEDVFAVLKDDLKDRLAMQINRAILVQLPDDKLEQLDRDLNSDAASVEGFEKMVTEAGVDIAKTTQDVMEAFRNREYDVLVSTTVIEVGVDVPNATIMVIYNAERFGLSQLHQLRGRVGRGDKQSYCFLLMGSDTEVARARLSVLKNNSDGFAIAESDLKMRGGGDFMGTRQSGHVIGDLKNLRFPVSAIFTAKAISDDAFSSAAFDTAELRRAAMQKYNKLKDVILN